MGRRSDAATPTPRGNTLDGQLRLSFRQVLRNGAMGIDQCAFVGTHFGVDSATVRKSFANAVPGGGTVDEQTFLEVMEQAIRNSTTLNKSPAERPRMLSKNRAMLHKEMSMNPFEKLPIVLPKAVRAAAITSPGPSMIPALAFDLLSPANNKRARLPSQLMTPSMRLNRSFDTGIAATPRGSPTHPRSHSVPLTSRTNDVGNDTFQKPNSAMYMKPYTPRGSLDLPKWKWNQVDNNVPKNIRNALLRPLKMPSRVPTPASKSPELKAVLERMKVAMRGITRMECISALTSATVSNTSVKSQATSVVDAKHALQLLGFHLTDKEVLMLAQQCKALAPDGESVRPIAFTNAIIPIAEHMRVADVGIEPEQFSKFKQQRLSFTRALSKKEVQLLELLRDKLSQTCLGGPAELRKAFKVVDDRGHGTCNIGQMITALELSGLGMSRSDAEVLYSILDPEQKGLDYNAFTAMMMPPDIAEAQTQTVSLGHTRGDSKSRQGLRDRQTGGSEKSNVKTKPHPGEVEKFMSRLTPDNVIQVLKNRVALALKAGPGAIRKWFSLFDKDGNNMVDKTELKDLLVDFGLHLSNAQVSALMKKLDTNHNGLLDQAELIAALLPSDQFSLTASAAELKDPFSVGSTGTGSMIEGSDLRNFLRDKLIRTFVKKGDKTSPGYQIREAISRFDTNKDGQMSMVELRKALNGLGLSVDDEMVTNLIACYDSEGLGSVEYSKFVEDIDPSAFNYTFCAGLCAKSGSFEQVEKEAVASPFDPPQKIRNTLKAALKARLKKDGVKSVLKEIQAYGDSTGALSPEAFRAMLLRLGLKIDRPDNLNIAYKAFAAPTEEICDVWSFAANVEADFERVPCANDKDLRSPKIPPYTPKPGTSSRISPHQERKVIGASTVVEPKPFG